MLENKCGTRENCVGSELRVRVCWINSKFTGENCTT